ncbi:T9SS type A sorting domain-containing protein [Brumimicrobium glaciale]|uniref:T9SS type A sorting domain-containing protein n=1 Tax=Brumimicrobium glaciale TaxID=200475 RepID=A0A4Q4KGE8_9FLAO|nr:T9SS type A sorting domain-containing protein [Brumimicrobium glaciale]RYM30779.1 T9SS type A sorting domain-containing protein [Brumimicrobium glaciale]
MKYLFILFIALSSVVSAQDETLSIVSYNLLNYPDGRDDCGSNTIVPNRADTLKKITNYLQPDIFVACEVQTQAGVDAVLNDALNGNGNTNYIAATFNGSGYLHNAMFYNSDKLVLKSQHVVVSSPREIDHYILYLKDPNLNVYFDTTFIEVYMMHLKAGNSSSSEAQRDSQTQILMNYIANRPTDRNVFVCGDMNVYSSNDDGYQNMTSGSFALKDPINTPGNWNNSSSYAAIHTQSTRTSANFDCGSKGGMDDRFDQILVSQNVLNNNDNVQYQTGSYRAVGNDGNHYNSSLISGSNSIYPSNVVRALYYMSDHLPVELKVDINYPTSNGLALVPSQNNISCNNGNDGEATITPNLGQAPYTFLWDANANNQTSQTATNLSVGTYCVTVTDDLGEVDDYCINITEPDAILFNTFITPDNSGDCLGDIQIIVGGGVGPYTFTWTDFPANTSPAAVDLCIGTYEVTITDANGCELIINPEVGGVSGLASEIKGEQLIQLFPNPANEKLTIHAENNIQSIKVLAITGREMNVDSNKIKDNLYELNTSKLSTGTYIVMMNFDGVWVSSRIVVQ